MGEQKEVKDMYVYDLPYVERNELCSILDINNQWEILGGKYMKFGRNDLEKFRRAGWCEKSPTDRMLQEWGQQNKTILELFYYLYEMGHYQAMSAIKSCVPVQYHDIFNHRERFKSKFESEGFVKGFPKAERVAVGRVDFRNGVATAPPKAAEAVSKGDLPQHLPEAELGATALPSPVLEYGSENLDKMTSSPRGELASKKVPEDLLCPSPVAALERVKPKLLLPQYGRPSRPLGTIPETKILNKPSGGITEMSCEDNNQHELEPDGSKAQSYHVTEDYMRMAEEKRARIESEAAGREMLNQETQLAEEAKRRLNDTVGHPPVNLADGFVSPPSECRRQLSNTSAASDISRHSDCVLPMIPYKELEEATACWSKDNHLGRGGFGVVFKGKWKNSEVAVKKIHQHENVNDSAQLQITEALGELKLCLSHQHDNILQVYGYSADLGHPPCIVYQFMPNGSVEDRLLLRKLEGASSSNNWVPLTWSQRFIIALGTAKALQFLHTVNQRPLIHGDVKSANILLDKHLEPKLGDFGLAREGKSQSTSLKVTRINGTRAYLPNDFLRSKKLSVKVDTYSYGIVLFELCTGLRALDEKRKGDTKYLKNLVEETPVAEEEKLRDQTLERKDFSGIFPTLLGIAKTCVRSLSNRRPDMTEVFSDLEKYQLYIHSNMRCGVPSSPYHLQFQHDMARRSGQTPSSKSLTFMQPPSIPPLVPKLTNPPLYPIPPQDGYGYQHQSPHLIFFNPENRGAYPALEGRPILNPSIPGVAVIAEPPPTYNEVVSPSPNGYPPLVNNNGPVNALLPKISDLNIGLTSQNLTNAASNGYAPIIGNPAKDGGSFLPLLTELGQPTPQNNQSEQSRPSAANKKSFFDDDDDDDDDDDEDDDD
ncbi:LOW QUALITY PROTEIN: uncharacterized protein LOC135224495 [Macrobrachium nipponense]|uniref:LOW QUALITY PROTEIN: uncharacterized protein LOC135224495 n=1 Tax=Macrobrachium nipponense TaxID=159736 RepID=UPI0030C82FF4